MHELFRLEQFSRDSFRVKRTYIDICGDLVAGILLGQIVYWFMPNEHGKSKLRVWKDGELWLAKGRDDWWDEIRITAKQFDRAIKILENKGFITTKKFKFNGAPTIHIRLNIDKIMEAIDSILTDGENGNSPDDEIQIDQTVNSISTIGENGFLPKGKIQFTERGKTLTETTTEITTDNTTNISIPYREIVDYLNAKAGTSYRHTTKKTQQLIRARWNEGFRLDDFKTVIDKKVAEWLNDPKMNKYLRPETLFGTKFESYLNQKGGVKNDASNPYSNLF
jgi:uncharacterized phage protein (TIGR02220 family)